MIVNLCQEPYKKAWRNFVNSLDTKRTSYDWSEIYSLEKIRDVRGTNNLISFDSEQDAVCSVLKWS